MSKSISINLPDEFMFDEDFEAAPRPIEKNYSAWLAAQDEFTPAMNMKIKKSLPAGIYSITYDRNGIHFVKENLNSDEVYSFENSYTEQIVKDVTTFWEKKDIYKKYNLTHKRGILLSGPAGTGKSCLMYLVIKTIIEKYNGVVLYVNSPEDFEGLYSGVNQTLRKIEPERPILTIIEDIDKLIGKFGTDAPILNLLDGNASINHHVVLMTSNDTSELSDAMLRPSRIDLHYVINPPKEEVRKEFLLKKGLNEEESSFIASQTEGLTFAQLKEVFIGSHILDKPVEEVIESIKNPTVTRDFLDDSTKVTF